MSKFWGARILFAMVITPSLAKLERFRPDNITAFSKVALSSSDRFKVNRGFNCSFSGVVGRPFDL